MLSAKCSDSGSDNVRLQLRWRPGGSQEDPRSFGEKRRGLACDSYYDPGPLVTSNQRQLSLRWPFSAVSRRASVSASWIDGLARDRSTLTGKHDSQSHILCSRLSASEVEVITEAGSTSPPEYWLGDASNQLGQITFKTLGQAPTLICTRACPGLRSAGCVTG